MRFKVDIIFVFFVSFPVKGMVFGPGCWINKWMICPFIISLAVFALRIWNFLDIRTSKLEQLGGPNKNLPDRRIFLKYLNPFPFLLILLFSYVVYLCLCLCKFINKVDYTTSLWHLSLFWDHSRYAPSQWEMLFQWNDVSHWLGAYLDWTLFIALLNTAWFKDAIVVTKTHPTHLGKLWLR